MSLGMREFESIFGKEIRDLDWELEFLMGSSSVLVQANRKIATFKGRCNEMYCSNKLCLNIEKYILNHIMYTSDATNFQRKRDATQNFEQQFNDEANTVTKTRTVRFNRWQKYWL